MCAVSGGLVGVTGGSAVRRGNFHEGAVPGRAEVGRALAHVDWRALRVSEAGGPGGSWAQLADPQAAVDVGGIAKGWIADRLSARLAEHGLDSFVVNLGGNVMARGQKPDGSPWRVGLQDPRDQGSPLGAVTVRDASAVTSGVYERCFERDGVFYHHILDPKTGFPVETDAAGATVVARRSIDAEGYSTTLLALGHERGLAFARQRDAHLGPYFEDRADKVAGVFGPVVIAIAVVTAAVWLIATGGDVTRALTAGVAVLVISCPCALVISIPLSFFAGSGGASKAGVLVKGSNYLEILSQTEGTYRAAVLGDMFELGELGPELHRSMGEWAASLGNIDGLLAVGDLAWNIYDAARENGMEGVFYAKDRATAKALLPNFIRPGGVILVTASRGMAFEEITREIQRLGPKD